MWWVIIKGYGSYEKIQTQLNMLKLAMHGTRRPIINAGTYGVNITLVNYAGL